jgi:SAM-dependent MidA family methyltransferase
MSGEAPYDPTARRDTPLARKLKERIRREGPLFCADYMAACLLDDEHGYYRTRAAIGRAGDFITAPEISQVFGELIGLWCVATWRQMGAPRPIGLVELGPGRGTLMRDALRAIAKAGRDMVGALAVRLVEVNAALLEEQKRTLAGAPVAISWGHGLAPQSRSGGGGDATQATIVIGNEFLDTAMAEQFVRRLGLWHVRCVGLDAGGELAFAIGGPAGAERRLPKAGGDGDVFVANGALAPTGLAMLARHTPLAALMIDYGHTDTALGDTLQAVRNHRFEHPLTSPGEADLTVQVDFAALASDAHAAGLAVDGPVTQAEFLGSLGIMERTSRLLAANPAHVNAIETGVARLMNPQGMGTRFKAIGLRSPQLPPLPGFPVRSQLPAPRT